MPKKAKREEKKFTGHGLPQSHTISVPISDVEKEILLQEYNSGSADKSKPQPSDSYKWTFGTITAAACAVTFICIVYVMYMFQSTAVTIETNIVFAPGVILVQKETQLISKEEAKIKNIPKVKHEGDKCSISNENKFDCYPSTVSQPVTEAMCTKRGCCFQKVGTAEVSSGGNLSHYISVPWCYFPEGYPTYQLKGQMKETTFGFTADLERTTKSPWPEDIMELKLDAYLETKTRFHFKVS